MSFKLESTDSSTSLANENLSTKSSESEDQCYCLKFRNLNELELQCSNCSHWFHKACVSVETGPIVKFMTNYQFVCKKCSPNGVEQYFKKQASFHQLCLTTLANLSYDDRDRILFSKERDIIPYIERNWDAMTNAPRRTKSTWHATIARTMTREDVFVTRVENQEIYHGLRDFSFERIGPLYENPKPSIVSSSSNVSNRAQANGNDFSKLTLSDSTSHNNNAVNLNGNNSLANSHKRGSKRKIGDSSGNLLSSQYGSYLGPNAGSSGSFTNLSSKRRGNGNDLSRLERMVPTCFPLDHPFNKDGYRYHLVEPDPHSPLRQQFEETELWAGKPLPGHLYRLFLESKVALALHDRAPQLKLSDDRMCVTGEKGYSMVRATHGASHGTWYFEVTIKEKPNNSALRIGWAQQLANLQAPCGYDKFSYSWRSRKGTVFHNSIGKTYSRHIQENLDDNSDGGYDTGDVLGFLIHLPSTPESKQLPDNLKTMTLVKFKNHLYYEEKDNFTSAEKSLKPLPGSYITFYKNDKCQGIAFKDVYSGTYYPAISIYKNASVVINFGPTFAHPPQDQTDLKSISELVIEKFAEHTLSDLVFHLDESNHE